MNILVSACLLGTNCRYNGGNNKCEKVIELGNEHTLIPICPEYMGGLKIPRTPCEIREGRVCSSEGEDLTDEFFDGAEQALYIAQEKGCQIAILKERSPSCGFGEVYDGSFSKKLVRANGITAQLLYDNGIQIIGESKLDKLKDLI